MANLPRKSVIVPCRAFDSITLRIPSSHQFASADCNMHIIDSSISFTLSSSYALKPTYLS